MGSAITLALGNLELDWGKNSVFQDHGPLFQSGDVRPIPYHYVDNQDRSTELKQGYSKPLLDVVKRVELLGYTPGSARKEYEMLLSLHEIKPDILPFDRFAEALQKVDVRSVSIEYEEYHDFGDFFPDEIFDRLRLANAVVDAREARWELREMMENFHPWSTLRLLAENPSNLDVAVTWSFADVVEAGWVDRGEVVLELPKARQFLIVTEGSSDAKVLSKALNLLRPEIADFFYFVDMEEGYPFSGTGNLYRFIQGLVSIGVLNQVLVIYDNDAEGSARFAETERLNIPPNMRVMKLPAVPAFEHFSTIGPNGPATEDINGRAAAMECYLDLSWGTQEQPFVRWKSYNADVDCYQGELAGKEAYARRFLGLRRREPEYDFSKLTIALDAIVSECVDIAGSC